MLALLTRCSESRTALDRLALEATASERRCHLVRVWHPQSLSRHEIAEPAGQTSRCLHGSAAAKAGRTRTLWAGRPISRPADTERDDVREDLGRRQQDKLSRSDTLELWIQPASIWRARKPGRRRDPLRRRPSRVRKQSDPDNWMVEGNGRGGSAIANAFV